MKFHLYLVVACLFALLHTNSLALEQPVPAGGKRLLADDVLTSIHFVSGGDAVSSGRLVDINDGGLRQVFEITVTDTPRNPWDVALYTPVSEPINRGDILLLVVLARSLRSEDESGLGRMNVKVDHQGPPWQSTMALQASITRGWKMFYLPARASHTLPDGKARVSLRFGFRPQTVQIGAVQLLKYGPDQDPRTLPVTRSTYEGREPDATWRSHAARDIERYRKAPLRVSVRNARDVPIKGATVEIEMQRHAFGFGSVVNPAAMWAEGPNGERYRETVIRYFNKAPTESGFRWQNWTRGTPAQIAQRKDRFHKTLNWLVEHDIEVRGHYLMWAPLEARNKPPELLDKRDELLSAFWKHAEKKARWGGERVAEWDAVNHIVGWNMRFADVYGESIYGDLIKRAREWAPHAEMWVNEGQILIGGGKRIMSYRRIIKGLTEANAAPDGIGFMGHFRAGGLPHPEEVYRRLSFFGNEIPRLQLTELDVDAGLDDQLQADYLRDVMTVAFSHPAVEGVVLWGFWEGRHWRPDAALWRKDWSIKPAGQAWLDLVFKQWWTKTGGESDGRGAYRTRAFMGRHKITATHDGRSVSTTVELPPNGATAVLRFDP